MQNIINGKENNFIGSGICRNKKWTMYESRDIRAAAYRNNKLFKI